MTPERKPPVILLVDDDPAMLRLLGKWLEADGYTVRCAQDGNEAMESIAANCPDILVTDWEMPIIDGMELCRWARKADLPHYLYTIFLTVRSGSKDMVRGLEAGADDFLKKPVDRDELIARVRAGMRVLELESRLSLLAKLDPLTGLLTQRSFYEQVKTEWERSVRHNIPVACLMIDIDYFKRVNDVYGHGVGDEVIRRVARVLQSNCRGSDLVSRYGGEEFCVLLPQTDEASASIWADRVRREIAGLELAVEETELNITASIGVAERRHDTCAADSLVELADQALLVAKQSGRDRVVMYHAQDQHAEGREFIDNRARLFDGVRATAVMTTIVAGLRQDETIGQATRYFLRFRIGSAPVVDTDGKLVGILSDKDCLATMLTPGWSDMRIREVMKHNVVCYDESTPVQTIYEFLCRVSIRTVVIVSDGAPVGVITRGSLLRWASNVLRSQQVESPGKNMTTRDASGCESPRERIVRTTWALRRESERLEEAMNDRSSDLTPCVVGGASRMQELINDLLASARYANDQHDDDMSHEAEALLSAAHNCDSDHGESEHGPVYRPWQNDHSD
jgi:diguanylate cyclase (GGDEF)-like protein